VLLVDVALTRMRSVMSAPEVPLLLTMIAIDDVPHAGIEAENFSTSYPGLRDCRDVETARFRRTVPGTCPIYWRSSVKDS
jgi:hypothetical protein